MFSHRRNRSRERCPNAAATRVCKFCCSAGVFHCSCRCRCCSSLRNHLRLILLTLSLSAFLLSLLAVAMSYKTCVVAVTGRSVSIDDGNDVKKESAPLAAARTGFSRMQQERAGTALMDGQGRMQHVRSPELHLADKSFENNNNYYNNYRVSCDRLEDSVQRKVCEVEHSYAFYSPEKHPLVFVKDVSFQRYYATRDVQGWSLAFRNISFEVLELSYRTGVSMADMNVYMCLSSDSQDRHCLSPNAFKALNQGQRFNQLHGIRGILWKKDAFCYTLREATGSYGGRRNFTFPCWVLPGDSELLQQEMNSSAPGTEWIVKPNAKGEGHGIFIVNSYDEIDSTSSNYPVQQLVVQPYLGDPFLINGKKFDFRTYVLVTSITPLRAYLYKEGLVRFASGKYDKNATRGGSEQQFLTNTSVGKKYTKLANLTWTFERLKLHFDEVGLDYDKMFDSMSSAIVRTLLCTEHQFHKHFQSALGGYDCRHCFHLLGVDVILDSHLNPIIIEVNGLPSMQLSHDTGAPPNPSDPYTATKFGLLHDILQILFRDTPVYAQVEQDLNHVGVGIGPGDLCNPANHVLCIDQKELRNVIISRREYINKGAFSRVYPSPSGDRYSKLIQHMHQVTLRHMPHGAYARTLWRTHHLYTALEKLYHSS